MLKLSNDPGVRPAREDAPVESTALHIARLMRRYRNDAEVQSMAAAIKSQQNGSFLGSSLKILFESERKGSELVIRIPYVGMNTTEGTALPVGRSQGGLALGFGRLLAGIFLGSADAAQREPQKINSIRVRCANIHNTKLAELLGDRLKFSRDIPAIDPGGGQNFVFRIPSRLLLTRVN